MNVSERIKEWISKGDVTVPLDLSCLHLTTIPNELPDTLQCLHCHYNQLTKIPQLPSTLQVLFCYNNRLISLPQLPATLQVLYCYNNQLTSLPQLSVNLQRLCCDNNQLTSLPQLPATLQDLYCYNNLFLVNWSRVYNSQFKNPNKHAWSNYRILCKIQRNFHKRKRRRYWLCCKNIITNDISSLVVRYL